MPMPEVPETVAGDGVARYNAKELIQTTYNAKELI